MTNEIKEIIDKITDEDWYEEKDLTGTKWIELKQEETNLLYDYITNLQKYYNDNVNKYEELLVKYSNLQEEVEDLREDNYAQNKREFRSKFLKEFQEEFGTNTFPDYDEIYKRYDKIKKENERLKEEIEILISDDDNDSVWLEDYNI